MAENKEQVIVTGKQYRLDWRDGARGFLMAVIGAALGVIYGSLSAGSLTFNWEAIGVAAGINGVGYLIKNFFTPSEIVVLNPPKADVKAVEQGRATVEVTKNPSL